MPDKDFAPMVVEPDDGSDDPFLVRLVPRRDIAGLEGKCVTIQIKDGATNDQVDKLQALISLLGVALRIENQGE